MHQRRDMPGHEPVVDEHVLLDPERRVLAVEIARLVAGHAVTQDQILRARGSPDGIRLDEAEAIDGVLE